MNQPVTPARNEVATLPVDLDWLALADKEEILEPDLAIVDTHHHLHVHHESRYLVPDLQADMATAGNVIGTVFVQSGGNFFYRRIGSDEMRVVGETEVIVSMTKGHKNVANGIIGYADLMVGSRIGKVLDAHMELGDNRFRGVRQLTIWDKSDSVRYYLHSPFRMPTEGMVMDKTFREGFAELSRRKLVFDCTPSHTQLDEVTDLAKTFPDTTIMLDHIGCVVRVGPYAGKHDEIFAYWKTRLKKLAGHKNVFIKIGGLAMQMYGFNFRSRPKPPNSRDVAELWKPFVETSIEIFGPDRTMMESNFPVDKGSITYAACWNALKRITAGASAADKVKIFSGTAIKAYGLKI